MSEIELIIEINLSRTNRVRHITLSVTNSRFFKNKCNQFANSEIKYFISYLNRINNGIQNLLFSFFKAMSKISTKLLMAVISAQVLLQFHFTQDFGHLGDGEVLITNMSFNLNFKKE